MTPHDQSGHRDDGVSLFDPDGQGYDAGLFHIDVNPKLAPTPNSRPSRSAAEHRKVARRIALGEHPLGRPIYLHADAPRDLDYGESQHSTSTGPRCGSCVYRQQHGGYPKCLLPSRYGDRITYPRASGSETSDIAAWWPACTSWEGKAR